MNYHDFFIILYITLYITLVFGVAETSFLQGFQDRLISVRLTYRVPIMKQDPTGPVSFFDASSKARVFSNASGALKY